MGRICVLAVLSVVVLPLWVTGVQAQDTAVDIELIIATDVSNSMDLASVSFSGKVTSPLSPVRI